MSRYRVEVDAVITTVLYIEAGETYGAIEEAVKKIEELDLPEHFELGQLDFKRWGWQANEAEEILESDANEAEEIIEDQEVPD